MKSPGELFRSMRSQFIRGKAFMENDLWYKPLPPARSWQGLMLRFARFLHLVYLGFREDRLRLHAASLTYSTLMSLLPLLAIVLAIAEGFGQHQVAVDKLLEYTSDMPQQFETFVQSLIDLVSQTDFTKMGAIGGLFLIYMIIQVLSRIEASFNQIWNIDSSRTWLRRASNYISVVVIVPILLIGAITVTANLKWASEDAVWNLFRWAPYASLWIAFAFLYGAMPNTRVNLSSAVVGGLIGALMWQGWFKFYILLQPGITRYNALYGALASIPVFLAWLYVSWLIILLGARICYAVQAGGATLPHLSRRMASIHTRIQVAVAILVRAARTLTRDEPPLERKMMVRRHRINPELLESVLDTLVQADLLAETTDNPPTFLLVKAPERITLQKVIRAFLDQGDHVEDLGIDHLEPSEITALSNAFEENTHLSITIDRLSSETDEKTKHEVLS